MRIPRLTTKERNIISGYTRDVFFSHGVLKKKHEYYSNGSYCVYLFTQDIIITVILIQFKSLIIIILNEQFTLACTCLYPDGYNFYLGYRYPFDCIIISKQVYLTAYVAIIAQQQLYFYFVRVFIKKKSYVQNF